MATSRAMAAAMLRSAYARLRFPCAGFSNAASSSRFSSGAVSIGSASRGDFAHLMKLPRQLVLVPATVGSVRCYAKRAKKWQGGTYDFFGPGAVGFGFVMINPNP